MPDKSKTDTPPKETFEDLVGDEEKSVNNVADTPEKGEQSEEKPDTEGDKPKDQSGDTPGEEGEKPEDKTPDGGDSEGDDLFWGKFKTEADAQKSYDEAQGKIIEQGKELNEAKGTVEENDKFLNTLDKALLKNPELADQLKAAIASEMGESKDDKKPEEKDQKDLDAKIEQKLDERENRAKIKRERDKWIEEHPEFKKPELGHKVLDVLESEGLPFTAKTLDIAYNYVTKDDQMKKAKADALKQDEVHGLEREEASAVGGGEPSPKGKTPKDNPFDNLVGESINPNSVR